MKVEESNAIKSEILKRLGVMQDKIALLIQGTARESDLVTLEDLSREVRVMAAVLMDDYVIVSEK